MIELALFYVHTRRDLKKFLIRNYLRSKGIKSQIVDNNNWVTKIEAPT